MKCVHCQTAFHADWTHQHLERDTEGDWCIKWVRCSRCKMLSFMLEVVDPRGDEQPVLSYPRGRFDTTAVAALPAGLAADYREACLILTDSPKASAALSRRSLQNLLREKAGIQPGSLADEIQQVLDSKQLPPHLAESIDAVRTLGNFAAHPIKSEHTSEIVDVEEREAEWLLEILEHLFNFYFEEPRRQQELREALERKLESIGKPPLKKPKA